ncbi:MAG: uroporphyrinogen decarboxylase family protein [Armatimonadota bacterium]|nr:uroporphyrinogen decarboxylase family protein [bacterium]
MTSKERMRRAMSGEKPDRVPLMCQISLGHIYKYANISPEEYWYTSKGMAEGYIRLADRYHFDGILMNVLGINPDIRTRIKSVEKINDGHIITWDNGSKTICPSNDDPRPVEIIPSQNRNPLISEIDIDSIKVIDSPSGLPPYILDIVDYVMEHRGDTLSIHGEIGTVFERFLELIGSLADGLMAMLDDPDKCKKILELMNQEVIAYAHAQCSRGVDAFKLSSPYVGAGFISRDMYEEFILPYERDLVSAVHDNYGIPCYIHTCGAIGDRLDLMLQTGTDGLECLDPPPLGTVDLEQAINNIGDKIFIKGNLDSVNELLGHSPQDVKEIARKRIELGKKAKGFILSSACSVSPLVPSENIDALYDAVEEYGKY